MNELTASGRGRLATCATLKRLACGMNECEENAEQDEHADVGLHLKHGQLEVAIEALASSAVAARRCVLGGVVAQAPRIGDFAKSTKQTQHSKGRS